MTFAGINYLAVLVAAAVGFGVGGVWYRLLARPWMAAHGFTSDTMRAITARALRRSRSSSPSPPIC